MPKKKKNTLSFQPFYCATCDKSFTKATSSNDHEPGHLTIPLDFCCLECQVPRFFGTEYQFKLHQHYHTHKFCCSSCRNRFKTSELLNEHQLSVGFGLQDLMTYIKTLITVRQASKTERELVTSCQTRKTSDKSPRKTINSTMCPGRREGHV